MYDHDPGPDYPYPDRRDGEPGRLRMVAYVDGRLVDTWTEEVEFTRWAEVARRFDRERRAFPPPPPPVPTHQRVLAWLDDVCGTRDAVLGLGAAPLDDEPDLPETDTPQARARLGAAAELLDAFAGTCSDPELAVALRTCLVEVWLREPEVVMDAATAAHVAGGVAWVVAKANGVLGPHGRFTVTRLKDSLALHPSPATYGKVVQRALVGYRDFDAERTGSVHELPDLLRLGRPELLLASTRRTLRRARDRALEAERASAA